MVGETPEDRRWREKGYESERQQAAADNKANTAYVHEYIVGDTNQYRIERQRFDERERLKIAADKARAEALAWQETQERWRKEEAAAKIANAEDDRKKKEWLAQYKEEETRLKGTPEQQAAHKRRVAESDAAFQAQREAQREAKEHSFCKKDFAWTY